MKEPIFDAGAEPKDKPNLAVLYVMIFTVVAAAVGLFIYKPSPELDPREARLNLVKIAEGLEAYRLATHVQSGGQPVAPSFPASGGPTPEAGSCCEAGGSATNVDGSEVIGAVCGADLRRWEGASWRAIKFALVEPHQFAYAFETSGDEVLISARGDADCDGDVLVLQLKLEALPDGSVRRGEIEVLGED